MRGQETGNLIGSILILVHFYKIQFDEYIFDASLLEAFTASFEHLEIETLRINFEEINLLDSILSNKPVNGLHIDHLGVLDLHVAETVLGILLQNPKGT